MPTQTISRTRSLLRTLVIAVLASALALTGTTVSGTVHAPAAEASGGHRVALLKKAGNITFNFTNQKRKAHKVPRLKRNKHLNNLAAAQAKRMAKQQRLHHTPSLGKKMKNWCSYGENVARASTVGKANKSLWRSPIHRKNMLNRKFDQMGTGVAWDSSGNRWVVQVFRKKC